MKKNDNEKDIERLRWQYLMRSENFMTWWKILNEYHEHRDGSVFSKLISISDKGEKAIRTPGRLAIMGRSRWIYLSGKTFDNASFDEYWEMVKKSEEKFTKEHKSVEYYSEIITKQIDAIVREYKSKESREPSIEELKKGLKNIMSEPWLLYLMITQRNYSQKEATAILKEVAQILKKRTWKKRFVKDELQRYLEVYDMRKQQPSKPYKEIHKAIYPKGEFTENARRALLQDLNKAKRIIKNVENNVFYYW